MIVVLKINLALSYHERLKYAAMFALAFYCWLRMEELENLKVGDLLDQDDIFDEKNVEYFHLTLRSRKTDQDANGTYYNLYDNIAEPELMVFTRLSRWLKC